MCVKWLVVGPGRAFIPPDSVMGSDMTWHVLDKDSTFSLRRTQGKTIASLQSMWIWAHNSFNFASYKNLGAIDHYNVTKANWQSCLSHQEIFNEYLLRLPKHFQILEKEFNEQIEYLFSLISIRFLLYF